MNSIKKWFDSLTATQIWWIILSTVAVTLLGIFAGDSPINILIGAIGMFYVAVYSTGTRGAFLLGIVYVSLYTIICLKNRIMLDALQNIVLIPIYILSYIRWGKEKTKPRNLSGSESARILASAVFCFIALYALSKLLHGNYSLLDAFNTTCTLYAMFLGMYGISLNWALWSANNVASALTFGLALATPTGSVAVFAMKCIFVINGFIGWRNFRKLGEEG